METTSDLTNVPEAGTTPELGLAGMILSVGGTGEPILFSLRNGRPQRALFVVSELTIRVVEDQVLPHLGYSLAPDYCVLPDENNLESSYRKLREQIRHWLQSTRIPSERVCVDFTGGTKAMSAAITLAGMEFFSEFRYVAGHSRTKKGTGIVESGSEYVVLASNPWNVEAWKERERAAWLYQAGQPGEAARVLQQAAKKCSAAIGETLKGYLRILELLDLADRFGFGALSHQARRFRDVIHLVMAQNESAESAEQMRRLLEHWAHLEEELKKEGTTTFVLQEILCNAERRARQEKWDDAIARLYRATELWIQGVAFDAFGATFGRLRATDIPDRHREAFITEFGEADEDGVYRLGIMKLTNAVKSFGDHPDGERVAAAYQQLAPHLEKRNSSILAHGNRAASEQDYRDVRAALANAIGFIEAELPRWPDLRLGL